MTIMQTRRLIRQASFGLFALASVLIILGNNAASSQEIATPLCEPKELTKVMVTNVYQVRSDGSKEDKKLQVGDEIILEIDGLPALIDKQKETNKILALFIDGRPLKDLPAYPPKDPNICKLNFVLERTENSRDVWTYLLGRPLQNTIKDEDGRIKKVDVSVGFVDEYAIPSVEAASKLDLIIISNNWFWFGLAVFLVILGLFLFMSYKSDLLRDTVPQPDGSERRPYSLARVQAAWWFFFVIASYLFIGIITGDFSTSITSTAVILLGLGAATAVGSAFIDASNSSPQQTQAVIASTQETKNKIAALSVDIALLNKQIEDKNKILVETPPTKTEDQLKELRDELVVAKSDLTSKQVELNKHQSVEKKLENKCENWIKDIMSDVNGLSFHRFQIVAWALALGVVFVIEVYRNLAMPNFSDTLLGLLGISAGTYLGLKIPEPTVPRS